MNTNENSALNEGWQAQINFQVQQTNLEELKSWINNGKLQPTHKVRIKNLTWIEAQSIPAFQKLFELKKLNKSFPPNPPQRQPLPPVTTPVKAIPEIIKPETLEASTATQNIPLTPVVAPFQDNSEVIETFVSSQPESLTEPLPEPLQQITTPLETKAETTAEASAPLKSNEKRVLDRTKKIEAKPKENKSLRKTKKKSAIFKNILVFLVGSALLALLAVGGAYAWVFQLRPPLKIDEKNVSELIILDEKLTTDKVGLRLKIAAAEQESLKMNINEATSTQTVDSSQEIAKLEKQFNVQRKIIIENHRNKLEMNDFTNYGGGSFAVLMILFLLIRISSSKKDEPIEKSYKPKLTSFKPQGASNIQPTDSQNVNPENAQNIHITKSSDTHITKSPDLHTTQSVNIVETVNAQTVVNSSQVTLNKSDNCYLHWDKPAKFACESCSIYYCDECLKTIGLVENCCPVCQVVCKSLDSKNNEVITPKVIGEENYQVKQSDLEKNTTSNLSEIIPQNERSKSSGIILAFFSALFLASSIAYFWVYKISPRLEKKDDENSQSLALNKQQKSNEANISVSDTNKSIEAANMPVKNESVANATDAPCIDPTTNQTFVCDEETKRTLYEQTRKTQSVADAKKKVEGKTNTILSLIIPSSSPSPENTNPANQTINDVNQNAVDESRDENDKRRFIQIFIGSFILIFGFLVIPRFFRKG